MFYSLVSEINYKCLLASEPSIKYININVILYLRETVKLHQRQLAYLISSLFIRYLDTILNLFENYFGNNADYYENLCNTYGEKAIKKQINSKGNHFSFCILT